MNNIKETVFLCLCVVSNIRGMDLKTVISPQTRTDESQRLAYGFLSTKFSDVRALTQNLSSDDRDKIRKKIMSDKAKNGQILFNVVTVLPPELQNKIAMIICGGDKNLVGIFFENSIMNASVRVWSHQVFLGKVFPWVKKMSGHNPNWNVDTIAAHSKDVIVFGEYCNENQAKLCNYRALQSVDKFVNTFLSASDKNTVDSWDIKYAVRDSYTFKNFMKHQDEGKWCFLPGLLVPFAVKLVGPYVFSDLSTEDMALIAKDCAIQEEHNVWVREQYGKTKNSTWLKLIEEKFLNIDDRKHIILKNRGALYPASYVALGLMTSWRAIHYERKLDRLRGGNGDVNVAHLFFGGIFGLTGMVVTFVEAQLSYYFNSYVTNIENHVLGMACVTGCYAAIVSLWNVIKMRSVRKEQVRIREIPQLLKRTDIEIV